MKRVMTVENVMKWEPYFNLSIVENQFGDGKTADEIMELDIDDEAKIWYLIRMAMEHVGFYGLEKFAMFCDSEMPNEYNKKTRDDIRRMRDFYYQALRDGHTHRFHWTEDAVAKTVGRVSRYAACERKSLGEQLAFLVKLINSDEF